MTTSREVFLAIGTEGEILWSDASTTAYALPDSRERWLAIWRVRAQLKWLVHSHPHGPRAFSSEDVSTMQALDAALGKSLQYAVLAPDGLVSRDGAGGEDVRSDVKPWWVELLRLASGM